MTAALAIEPTFSRVPAGDEQTGQDCIDFALGYGVPLDESWQRPIVRGMLREIGGGWAASQSGCVVARQNGKGQIILAVELFGLFELGEQILHTAHAVRTSSDAFRRLWAVIQGYRDLAASVVRQSQQIGQEYIELDNGARIAFSTRSASVGRGLSLDRLIVDEAEDLPAAEVGALAPTVFARPRSQSLYFGTAPGPTHDSRAFAAMRSTAHDGLNPRLAWWEWCAPWGHDVDDVDMQVRVNPAVASGRVPLQAIADDRAILPLEQFQAERLSMWPPGAARHVPVISATAWEDLSGLGAQAGWRPNGLGVDMSHGGDVSIAGCWIDGETAHVEEVWGGTDVAAAIDWLTAVKHPRLEVVIDDISPASQMVPTLTTRRMRVRRTSARDMAKGCMLFDTRMKAGTLSHCGQASLTAAVMGVEKRPISDAGGWGWDRRDSSITIHQVVAATLALLSATENPHPTHGRGRGRAVSRRHRHGTVL